MIKFKKRNPLYRLISISVTVFILFASVFSVTAYSIMTVNSNNYDETENSEITSEDKPLVYLHIKNQMSAVLAKNNLSVGELLERKDITLSENQKLNHSLYTIVYDKMHVVISTHEEKMEEKTEQIKFETKTEQSDELYVGETKIKTEGENGEKLIRTKNEYIDGRLVNSTVVKTEIKKEPTDCIKLVGTKEEEEVLSVTAETADENEGFVSYDEPSLQTFTDYNGNTVSYKQVITGSGTAYTAEPGALTATGVAAYLGGVAVNPNVIPYGSKLYIVSSDNSIVYGYATAVDTGGALMSGSALVDLYYPSYDECVNFGRRNVNVYIL